MEEMKRLGIVKMNFSAPNVLSSSKDIDEQTKEVKLRWTPEVRAKIGRVRNKFIPRVRSHCLNFFSIYVFRNEDRDSILAQVNEADAEMKAIDPSLHAKVLLIPLYVEGQQMGELYQQVLGAIRGRVYMELIERLKAIPNLDDVPTRSRTSLLDCIEKMRKWNVLEDADVAKHLDEMKQAFANGVFKPIMEELDRKLFELKQSGVLFEIEDGE